MHTSLRSRSRSSAFTLIEILISMAIVGLVGIILATALQFGFSSQRAAEKSVDSGRSAEMVMDALRTDLQCAVPPQPTGTLVQVIGTGNTITPQTGGTLAGNFTGTVTTFADLVFFTTAPSPLHVDGANGEIKEIELTLVQLPGASDYALVRSTRNNLLPPNGAQENPDAEVLCRHVVGFDIQYYDGTQWLPTWDSTTANTDNIINTLPLAVQITLSLQSQENDSAGKAKVVPYVRVFALPCAGEQVDVAAAAGTATPAVGTSGGGG